MKKRSLLALILSMTMMLCVSLFAACEPEDKKSSDDSSPAASEEVPNSSTPEDSDLTVIGISYVSGLDEELYEKGSVLDLSALKIKATYSNGTTKEISYDEATFEVEYDSNVNGAYGDYETVTITYGGFSCEHEVIFYSKYDIGEVSLPAYYSAYLTATDAEKESVFTTINDSYKVGDDSAFSVRPTVNGINNFTSKIATNITDVDFVISVEKLVGEEFVLMDNPGTDVEIDAEKATVDFLESAIGSTYRVSVYPDMLNSDQMEELSNYVSTVEFEVVDGYNVTNAIELSVVDNYNKDWEALRAAAGLNVDENAIHGVVLHANIVFGKTEIPEQLMYNDGDSDLNPGDADYERAKDSLRDYASVLKRVNNSTEAFAIHGNYFTLNTSTMPLVMRYNNKITLEGEIVNSHSCLFDVSVKGGREDVGSGFFTVENLNAIGNLKLTDTNNTGGLIFFKLERQPGLIKNVTARQWYVTAFHELADSKEIALTLKDCQYYDNYSCFVYLWGAYINIENTVMNSCGGPVIIADNCHHDSDQVTEKHPNGFVSHIEVDDASKLESWVTGSETWFVQMNATSTASALTSLDALFKAQGGRTFLKHEDGVNKLNLVCIIKSGSSESMNFEKIKGSINIGDLKFSMDNPIVSDYKGQSVLFQGASETSLLAFFQMGDNQYLCDAISMAAATMQGQQPAPQMGAHAAFTGSHLGIYIGAQFTGGAPNGYMGVILGGYKNA